MPSLRVRLEQHGQKIVTLAGMSLSICTKLQQTAEINASYWMELIRMVSNFDKEIPGILESIHEYN